MGQSTSRGTPKSASLRVRNRATEEVKSGTDSNSSVSHPRTEQASRETSIRSARTFRRGFDARNSDVKTSRRLESLPYAPPHRIIHDPEVYLHRQFRQFGACRAGSAGISTLALCEEANRPSELLVGKEDGSIVHVNYETAHVLCRWTQAHRKRISSLTRPSYDGVFVSGGGADGTVKVWRLNDDRPVAQLKAHAGGVNGVDVHRGSRFIVSGGGDRAVRLWDLQRAQELSSVLIKGTDVRFVRFIASMNAVVHGDIDGVLGIWDVRTSGKNTCLSLTTSLKLRRSYAECGEVVLVRPYCLLTGHCGQNTEESVVFEWDLRAPREVNSYVGHAASVKCVRMSTSPAVYGMNTFITVSADGTVGVWPMPATLATGSQRHSAHSTVCVPGKMPTCCDCGENGDLLISLSAGGIVAFRPVHESHATLSEQAYRYLEGV